MKSKPLSRILWALGLALVLLTAQVLPVLAQNALVLWVAKESGYGKGSQIRGWFALSAQGVEDLTRVTFYLDETVLGEVSQAPFRLKMDTRDHPAGWHELKAVGQTSQGESISSDVRRFEFITADQEAEGIQSIILPVAGIVVAVLLLTGLGQLITFQQLGDQVLPLGTPRRYGVMGGTICPKCGRPFPLHIWGVKLAVARLERCEHCRKWVMVRHYSLDALRQAEAAELEMAKPEQPIREPAQEDKLRQQIDDSRYTSL